MDDVDLAPPEEYDEESYRAGFAAAMEMVASMASTYRGLADPEATPDDGAADPDEEDTCPECGGRLRPEMGVDGLRCLDCGSIVPTLDDDPETPA